MKEIITDTFKLYEKEASVDGNKVYGPGIDSLINAVSDMLMRGAPTHWDAMGFNKNDYNFFSFSYGMMPAKGSPIDIGIVVESLRRLEKYKARQLPHFEALKESVMKDLNAPAIEGDESKKIKFIGKGQFGKLNFFIPPFGQKRVLNNLLKEEMNKRLSEGNGNPKWREYDNPTFFVLQANKVNSVADMNTYQAHPSFFNIIIPFFRDQLGFDVSEMEAVEENKVIDKAPKLSKIVYTQLEGDKLTIEFSQWQGNDINISIKAAGFRGSKTPDDRWIWVNEHPDPTKIMPFIDLLDSKKWDTSQLKDALAKIVKQRKSEDFEFDLKVRDVTGETGNRWHLGVSFLKPGTWEGEALKEILKFSFANYSDTTGEGNRSIFKPNRGAWETFLAGDYQEYRNFISSLKNRGFNYQPAQQIIDSLISRGLIQKIEGVGDLDGYGSEEEFYAELDKFNLPFKLFPEQKESIARLYSHRSFLKGDETGTGKCVHGDSTVFVNDQIDTMENIWNKYSSNIIKDNNEEWADPKKDMYIHSVDDKGNIIKSKVTKLFRQYYEGNLRKITTSYGRSVIASFEHHFLNDSGEWVNNLNHGDIVCSPKKINSLINKNHISEEISMAIAWQIAEGHENKNTSMVHIYQKDINILEAIKDNIQTLNLDINFKIRKYDNRCPYLEFCSKSYRQFLESIGYKWGNISKNKEIPSHILSSKKSVIKAFLQSYFDAEASCDKRSKRIDLTSASQKIIKQISYMLHMFGVYHSFGECYKSATNGKNIKRKYYRLYIVGEGLDTFVRNIGFTYSYKNENYKSHTSNKNYNKGNFLPLKNILLPFYEKYPIPYRHLSPSKKYINGQRWASPIVVKNIIQKFEDIKSAKALKEYRELSPSKWTEQTSSIYNSIQKSDVSSTICRLKAMSTTDLVFEKIVKIETIPFKGYIYDLSIDGYHNYLVEGLVTHNTVSSILAGELRRRRHGGQIVVVTKAPIQSQFAEEVERFIRIKPGLSPTDNSPWLVLSYEYFKSPTIQVGDLVGREQIVNALIKKSQAGEITCLIMDEVHNVKNGKPYDEDLEKRLLDSQKEPLPGQRKVKAPTGITYNTFYMQKFAQNIPFSWGLSATVVANYPIDVYNQLKAINHPLGKLKWGRFAVEFGGMHRGKYGMERGTVDERLEAVNKLKEFLFDQNAYDALSKKQINEHMPEQIINSDSAPIDEEELKNRIQKRMSNYKGGAAVSAMIAYRNEIAIEKAPQSVRKAIPVLEQGKKVMIFSDFRDSLDIIVDGIQSWFDQRGLGEQCLAIRGGMRSKKRDEVKNAFKDPNSKARCLVLNIVAGGTGLDFPNITNDMIINDFDWSVANDEQMLGRPYRINSKEDVNVTYILAAPSQTDIDIARAAGIDDPKSPDQEFYERVNLKKEIAKIIHTMSMKQDALMKDGHRRGKSQELAEIEKKLNAAKKKLIAIEETDSQFEIQMAQKAQQKTKVKKKSSHINWFRKIVEA